MVHTFATLGTGFVAGTLWMGVSHHEFLRLRTNVEVRALLGHVGVADSPWSAFFVHTHSVVVFYTYLLGPDNLHRYWRYYMFMFKEYFHYHIDVMRGVLRLGDERNWYREVMARRAARYAEYAADEPFRGVMDAMLRRPTFFGL